MGSTAGNRRLAQIGSRIREARKHSGLTAKALATKAGIHPNTLSANERGDSEPSEETLLKLAQALGCSLDELRGLSPLHAPSEQAVVAFLEGFRRANGHAFQDWTDEMWRRYLTLGIRFVTANEDSARDLAGRVKREFRCIHQLLELFDANEADDVLATLVSEHKRWRQQVMVTAANGDTRLDLAHHLPTAHQEYRTMRGADAGH